jgi:hypothetical protein
MSMQRRIIGVFTAIFLMSGCVTHDRTVQEKRDEGLIEEQKTIELAPTDKEILFQKAREYQEQRDYANTLINIVRAENAPGDERLSDDIRQFKNNLLENIHARALDESIAVEIGKGLDIPLEYMVFYTEGEIIYPAFNIPVSFEVKKGEVQITKKSYTNPNGVAECEVIKVENLEEEEALITAGVSLEIDGEIFSIQKLQRNFTLHHERMKDQTISFVIHERNIDRVAENSASGKQIEQFFIENGFSVLHGINEKDKDLFMRAVGGDAKTLHIYKDKLSARLIAFTFIESEFSSKVSEGFYFAKSNIILDIVDTSTQKVVFNSVIEGIKGAGNTEEKAGTKAINEATGEFIEKLTKEIASLDLHR